MKIVIRAGGVGTRLWPWSRSDRPKQFLPLFSGKSPVQVAWARFRKANLAGADDIYVSVGKESLDLVLEQLPELHRDHIIAEPIVRDTAAAIGLETIWVTRHDGHCTIASLGSDHYVGKPEAFIAALSAADRFIRDNPGYLVAIACEPSRVETGYGYIKTGDVIGHDEDVPVYKVETFTEKPDYRTAEEYVASGQYLWNANFFVWDSETLMKQFREFEPEMYESLIALEDSLKQMDARETLREAYPRLKKVAIDYAVLEPAARAGRMAVIPVDMEWSDIGSWATLTDAFPPDENGNLLLAPVLADDTQNTTVVARNPERKIIATIGLNDMVIVDTRDALLICPKDQCAKVKRLVERMRQSEEWKKLV